MLLELRLLATNHSFTKTNPQRCWREGSTFRDLGVRRWVHEMINSRKCRALWERRLESIYKCFKYPDKCRGH
jgi:hypothetical protein